QDHAARAGRVLVEPPGRRVDLLGGEQRVDDRPAALHPRQDGDRDEPRRGRSCGRGGRRDGGGQGVGCAGQEWRAPGPTGGAGGRGCGRGEGQGDAETTAETRGEGQQRGQEQAGRTGEEGGKGQADR